MPRPDIDTPLQGLAERLLTLRVTVVLCEELDGHSPSVDAEATRSALHQTWSRYLDGLAPTKEAGPRAREDAPSPDDFAALATRAKQAYASLGGEGPEGLRSAGAGSIRSLEGRQAAAGDGTSRAIVQRIIGMCEQLAHEPDDELGRLEHRLLVAKAMALRTDPVLLETEVHINGDVTTRLNGAWLDEGGDRDHRTRTVLELQRMGVETAVTWWSKLVDLLAGAGRTLLELALKR